MFRPLDIWSYVYQLLFLSDIRLLSKNIFIHSVYLMFYGYEQNIRPF